MPYSVPLEDLLDKSEHSIYKLVILASKRALEIAEGQPKLVEEGSSLKPSTIALHEIAAGKVYYKKVKGKE
ncbi:MAG: DNA-directed RNA polymerase subunit omega [Candidatus Omnitrophota bacterium]|jgi:DNA-directed RNA polymerase omega subunit